MNKEIYIVLSQSYTMLSRIIKKITKARYSHVSISFDKSCTSIYSIGRKYTYWPFSGIYKEESIYSGVYKANKKSEVLIYELKVNDSQYENIIKCLDKYGKPSKGYNFIGLILVLFNKKVDRNKYYCSEFIYKVLSDDTVNVFPKTDNVVKPMDFAKINGLKTIYEGKIVDYDYSYDIIEEKGRILC